MPSLIAQTLGEGLSVITPDTPLPEQASLLAFARSQGLDEQAIAALWQNAAPAGTAPSTAQSAIGAMLGLAHGMPDPSQQAMQDPHTLSAQLTPDAAGASTTSPAFLFTAPLWASTSTSASESSVTTSMGSTETALPKDTAALLATAQATNPLHAVAAPLATGPSPAQTTLAVPGAALPPLASATTAVSSTKSDAPAGPTAAQVQWMHLAIQATPTQKSEAPKSTAETELLADPLHLAQIRAQLGITPHRANRSTVQTATPEVTTPNWAITNGKRPEQEPQLLDLEADLTQLLNEADSLAPNAASATSTTPSASALSTPQPSAAAASTTDSAVATPPRVISGFQLKADHYQQLADRMGQALAQRMQEQIDRGEWSLRLRLNPAELGQIDVQLDMQKGGLSAVFQADNPLTRDLIQQGSGRFKEGLAQSGMTVASVWVNSDGSRQSGGNSTPQQQQRRRSSPDTGPVNAAPSAAAAPRMDDDSWDMLA